MTLRVPEVVASAAVACGADGWLRDLPRLIADLEAEWSVAVGRPYPNATEALVAEATLADGKPAVLRLRIPHDGAAVAHEITMLQLAGGRGCAGLLRHDAARGALLLERLGPSLYELGRPFAQRLEILAATAAAVWRPAAGCSLPTGADKARRLADYITSQWETLGRPCTAAAVEDALACAARRIAAHDDERAVLVHGDVHQLNALQVPGGDTFKLIDPDGLLAEAECDLGVLMRNDPEELLTGDPWARARWLAERCGLDSRAIWEGRGGAGDERAAVHPDRPAAVGTADALGRRPPSRDLSLAFRGTDDDAATATLAGRRHAHDRRSVAVPYW